MTSYSDRLLLGLVLALAACKKVEVDALPKATQTGQHTFGCLVDGQAFGPKPGQAISINTREPLQGYIYHRDLLISARGDGYVDFALRNAFQPGTYPLGEINTNSYGTCSVSANRYFTDTNHIGTVMLTRIDTVAKVAAGTFQFAGFDYQSGKTVTVTEGRFDVRLK